MSVLPKNGKVAVVGAGVSGLSFSYFLLKLRPDLHISIFESRSAPGGWIKTEKLSDGGNRILLEKGPRTLRGVSDGTLLIVDIMRHLKLENQVEVMQASSIGNRKWLLDPSNNLVQIPDSVLLHLKFMLNDITQGLLPSLVKEPFQPKKPDTSDESIRSFVQRRFGSPALADNILSAVMHGIYSGDVGRLSAQATLPKLVEIEREAGSIVKYMMGKMFQKKKEASASSLGRTLLDYEQLISPEADLHSLHEKLRKFPILRMHDGLLVFPQALATLLSAQNNVDIHYNCPVDSMELQTRTIGIQGKSTQFDHIRFTLGARALLGLVLSEKLKQLLSGFEYSSIFLANVYSKKGGLIPAKGKGFGFLVPSRNTNPEGLLGVIYDSDTELDAQKLFGGSLLGKVPYDKITLMMGGHYFSERGIPSTKASIRAAKHVLGSILGVPLDRYNVVLRDEARELLKDVSLKDTDLLVSYNLHKDCIPQYNVGFLDQAHEMLAQVARESNGAVTLGGTGLGKLGVPDCVMNSLEDALVLR